MFKSFSNWFWQMVRNFGRILTELLSVKVVIMVIVTGLYWKDSGTLGLVGFIFTAVGWMLVVGVRFAESYVKIFKQAKE